MKKLLLSAVLLTLAAFSTQAQDGKNAIGLRLGDNDGFGAEVSYQRTLSTAHRLEFDLGWRNTDYYDAAKLAALYQWVWNIQDGFKWYAGVGGGIGTWDYNDQNHYPSNYHPGDDNRGTFAFAAGDIGIEYNFDFPLQLSLDLRPEAYFGNHDYRDNGIGADFGLGARYKF